MHFSSELFPLPKSLIANEDYIQLLQTIGWQAVPEYYIFPKRFCQRCIVSLRQFRVPKISKANGFRSVDVPQHMKELNTLEAACISCMIPCFTLSRRAGVSQPKTIGPAVYIPLDPTTTLETNLPQRPQDWHWVELQFVEYGRGARKDPTIRGYIDIQKVLLALTTILESPIKWPTNLLQ